MADFAPLLKKLLRRADCCFERQGKGDHEIWYSPISDLRL
ncbi:MAG: type II toxin-antitoxin system HicA family toxin, partial [Gammaproteobacteria bacterium]|nr:type II toxin-antitoxin system HicA family toxin [Gammaproteobacteria bacterium]